MNPINFWFILLLHVGIQLGTTLQICIPKYTHIIPYTYYNKGSQIMWSSSDGVV